MRVLPSESFIPKKKNTSKKPPQTHTQSRGDGGKGTLNRAVLLGFVYKFSPGSGERLCTFNVAPLTRLCSA